MKKFRNYLSALLFMAVAVLATSCDNNEEIQVDPNANFDVILNVDEAGPDNPNEDEVVNANTQSTIKAKVIFKSTTDMNRLYITQNVQGQGEEKFEPTENVDLKGDGSLDLTGKNSKDFEYQFNLPVPSGVGENGTVVYKFWVTSGKGDFREFSDNLIGTPGTITLKFGTATNPAAEVKSYSAKILAAPLKNGNSSTFISLLDGGLYKINEGAEYAALWDFGYYNRIAEQASLASTSYYETAFSFVNVDSIAGTSELNHTYFAKSDKTEAQFNEVTLSGSTHLDFATPSSEKVTGLMAGNIIEFEDGYGKKGLIHVVEVKGTYNEGDYLKINIKVQP